MILKINDRIRVRKLNFFNEFEVNLKYDAIASTFSYKCYFDPDNIEHKEMACIGHYHICTVEHNNELLITGQLLSEAFNSSSVRQMVSIGGYSLPGVLEDCEIPTSIYPLQFDLLGLREITQKIIAPFGLKMVIDPIVAAVMEEQFDESNSRASQNIKSYLTELANQKNVVISHNNKGQIVFTKAPATQKPIFHFTKELPATSMSLSFNGQAMHSHIKVMNQSDIDDLNGGEDEVRNPYVINSVFRPKVIIQNSGTGNDTLRAAKNALAQELKNLVVTIITDRWIIDGKIIRPGHEVSITNPDIYLYKKTNFLIQEVALKGNNEKTTATLTCVPPEAYNGVYPVQYKFAGINLH